MIFEAALLVHRFNHALQCKHVILLDLNYLLKPLKTNLLIVLSRGNIEYLVVLELLCHHPVLRDADHQVLLRVPEHLLQFFGDRRDNVTVLSYQTCGLSQYQHLRGLGLG